jgi:hypothetical protein
MTSRMCFPTMVALWLIVAGVGAQSAQAQTFTVLHNFTRSPAILNTASTLASGSSHFSGKRLIL